MTHAFRMIRAAALVAATLATAAAPTQAGSLATSSAAGGSSASVGSSASSEASSDSSSRRRTAAAGPYRITAMVALADQPGAVRLALQAVAPADASDGAAQAAGHSLVLPADLVARHHLAVGQVVTAQAQAYGLAYARGDGGAAFFLVLDDGWQRELDAQPVRL